MKKATDISEELKVYSFNVGKEVISEKGQILDGIEKEDSISKTRHRSHR